MGWKEYQEKLGVKHNFAKYGCKDFWVMLRRLDSFPYGETREPGGTTPEELEEAKGDPKKAEAARDRMESDLMGCIMDWHITDPTIQDKPGVSEEEKARSMPLPTEGDLTPLKNLPTEFIVAMLEWIQADSDIAKRVSKTTGTSSGQL